MRQLKDIEPRELVERIRAHVPEELRERPQWTLFKIGNDRKVPLSPLGGYASCSDSSTWSTFDHAAAVFLRNTSVCRGFNMATGSGLGGLDLDGVVREDGTLPEPQIGRQMYKTLLNHLGSYCEYSPSGRGIRSFFLYHGAPLPNRKKGEIELYFEKHFLSCTGDLYEGRRRLRDGTIGAARIEQSLRPPMPLLPQLPMKDIPEDDHELLERMFASRRGATIRRLWSGELLHKSDSESDYALMGDLAYWTGGDVERMIRLFLTSGRAERAKGRRADYLRKMAVKVSL